MKRILFLGCAAMMALQIQAQGNNTGNGGQDGSYESLVQKVLKLEKKNDAFQVYLNFAASAQAKEADGIWQTGFANKQLRLEIKGNLTDKLSYRFRHRLNKSNAAKSEDNFAKATDIMMVNYQFNPKFSVQAGKMCQIWGGFEFDENPMYIYQYSDMVDNMDNFMAGVGVTYKPVPTQEIAVQISDAYNGKFDDEYGAGAMAAGKSLTDFSALRGSNNPLTYIVNWNGSFFNDILQTRWSWGIQTQARGKYSRMLVLGQRLNLPKFQWYIDYMGAFDGLDRLRIATGDLGHLLNESNAYFSDVHYHSFITKANWQFAPQWNLMLKGMCEKSSVSKIEELKNYRTSYGYMASVEYFPVKQQDFRIFLAYIGRKYDFKESTALKNYSTNRIELGMMYRIKCF